MAIDFNHEWAYRNYYMPSRFKQLNKGQLNEIIQCLHIPSNKAELLKCFSVFEETQLFQCFNTHVAVDMSVQENIRLKYQQCIKEPIVLQEIKQQIQNHSGQLCWFDLYQYLIKLIYNAEYFNLQLRIRDILQKESFSDQELESGDAFAPHELGKVIIRFIQMIYQQMISNFGLDRQSFPAFMNEKSFHALRRSVQERAPQRAIQTYQSFSGRDNVAKYFEIVNFLEQLSDVDQERQLTMIRNLLKLGPDDYIELTDHIDQLDTILLNLNAVAAKPMSIVKTIK